MKLTKSYKDGHPRNQLTRDNFWNLNGRWDFTFDDTKQGFEKKWFNGFEKKYSISVPYVYNTPASNINISEIHNNLWYQKKINISKQKDKKYLLHFEGSDYETIIYINGMLVGNHKGAYERFTFNITSFFEKDILLVVNVFDDYSCIQPRGKQRWKDKNYECFYQETTGIWKTVWIEEVADTYLETVRITPNIDTLSSLFEYQINGDLNSVELETIISFNDQIVSKSKSAVLRENFKLSFDMTTDLHHWKIFYWSPDHPCLYDVEINIYRNGELLEKVQSYFGMRKFETKGNTIFLNYTPLYLKMVLDQGYYINGGLTATEKEIIQDIELTKEMGFNGVRKHEKIEDENFLYYADVYGLIVWLECPSVYEHSHLSIKNLSTELMDIVLQNYNHPSIMTYVIYNESWGVTNISGNISQQKVTEGLYHLTKSLDQTRMVISNDGWEHTVSDLITVHNYNEAKEQLVLAYNNMADNGLSKKSRYSIPRRTFVADYKYEGQPLILSEFAGIAFKCTDNIGWGYGNSVADSDEFISKLTDQVNSLVELKEFSGYCITQLTDVYQEVNGLLTMDRKYKCPLESIKKINSIV